MYQKQSCQCIKTRWATSQTLGRHKTNGSNMDKEGACGGKSEIETFPIMLEARSKDLVSVYDKTNGSNMDKEGACGGKSEIETFPIMLEAGSEGSALVHSVDVRLSTFFLFLPDSAVVPLPSLETDRISVLNNDNNWQLRDRGLTSLGMAILPAGAVLVPLTS
ncbi:hypothetical protein Pfo_013068 [Paulownia fortunei]|nr:hypothetical protein Pfo_013068 [Paulownia fortunei]